MQSSRLATAIAVGAALLVAGPLAGPAQASSVAGASLTLTSTSATATQVTYTVPFTATSGLTNGTSTITLAGPAGTVFPTSASCGGDYGVAVGNAPAVNCGTTITAGGGTNAVTFHSSVDAAAGAAVTVTVNGVTNASTTGPLSLQVSTSNDTTPVTLNYSLTAPTSLAATQLHLSSTSADATDVTYTLSATLTNGLTAGVSTFTFASPAGTVFPPFHDSSCGGDYSVSVNGGSPVFCSATVVSGGSTETITFNSPVSAKAGDKILVTINGVTSPTTPETKSVNVSTSSDPVAVAKPVTYTPVTSISGLSVVGSTTAPSATAVTYTVSFTTTNGLTAAFSTISVAAPGGTVFSNSGSCGGDYAFSVNGAHPVTCFAGVVSGGGTNAVVFNSAVDAVAGDQITITITNVANSSASGTQQITVSTSSDPGPVSAPLTLAGAAPPPTAANDSYATAENTALTVPAAGVLANDSASAAHALTAAVASSPSHGMVTLQPNGAFVYTPTSGFAGVDSFTYQAKDTTTNLVSNAATVTLTVDATPPTTTVPPPPPPVQTPPTITFCYSAADPQSGIASYDVRYRDGAWNHAFRNFAYPPGWQHTQKKCESLTGKPGHEYCLSMRAHDRAGIASGWSHEWCRALPLDDRAFSIAAGNWTRGAGSHYYRHTITTTGAHGARLQLAGAHVHRIAILVTRCAACGKFVVTVGGTSFTVDTHAGRTQNEVLLPLHTVKSEITTITVTARGNRPVYIDGIAILQD